MDKNKCNSCGETTHKCSCKNKDFTKAVIEIDNPPVITNIRKVVIPASMGDDTTVPPVIGKYHNVLLNYEANNRSYLYSSDGIPTLLTGEHGEQGPAGTVTVGTTTTGEPGSSASVENVGTPENAVLNFTVPQGPRVPEEEVQEDVDNKLDEMAEDGTLQEIVSDYLNSRAIFGFDTVADMKAATNLIDGSYAETLGYYAKGDGGSALYKIRQVTNDDIVDEMFIIEISSDPSDNLVAELIVKDKLHSKQLGLKGDGVTDETTKLNKLLDSNYDVNIEVDSGVYLTTGTVYVKGLWRQNTGNNGHRNINFSNATILFQGTTVPSVVLYNMFKTSVNGLCVARNSNENYVEVIGCWHTKFTNWDIQDLKITTSVTDLGSKTTSTPSSEYLSFDTVMIKGTMEINTTSNGYINCVNFYNSTLNPDANTRTYCVVLKGAGSKQCLNFINSDLSYATTAVFDVVDTQTGHCSINCYGCYFDSSIRYFSNDDKKGVMFSNMFYMAPAFSTAQVPNISYEDFINNTSYSGYGTAGSNLAISNINYTYNGDISFTSASNQSYPDLFGPSSNIWTKSYVSSNLSASGSARKIASNGGTDGDRTITVKGIPAPRTAHYMVYARMKFIAGSCTKVQLQFKGDYQDVNFDRVSGKEFVITNDKHSSVTAGTELNFSLTFANSSSDMEVEVYEVGVTDGHTYIPNAKLHASAVLS